MLAKERVARFLATNEKGYTVSRQKSGLSGPVCCHFSLEMKILTTVFSKLLSKWKNFQKSGNMGLNGELFSINSDDFRRISSKIPLHAPELCCQIFEIPRNLTTY